MKLVTLLRHAKSSWNNADLSDHDRPLNSRGLADAPMMAQRLLDRNCVPDIIFCSSAQRTRQTAQMIIEGLQLDADTVSFHESLYLASPGTLLDIIQSTDSTYHHAMVIAHNPGIESFGRQLHPNAPQQMPTCAVSHFALHSNSFVIEPDTQIDLKFADYPKSNRT